MTTEEAPPPRPPRVWYCLIQTAVIAVFYGLCRVAERYERIFNEMEVKSLPMPTEAFIALARAVRTPVGGAVLLIVLAVLIVVAWRGLFDRELGKLMIVNIVGVFLLIGFSILSLHMPLAQIQHALER